MEQTTGKCQPNKFSVSIHGAPPFEVDGTTQSEFLEFILAMEEAMTGLFMEADYIKKHGQAAFELHSRRN